MEGNSAVHGLTSDEARRIRETGGGNTPPEPITKPTKQIVREPYMHAVQSVQFFLLPPALAHGGGLVPICCLF